MNAALLREGAASAQPSMERLRQAISRHTAQLVRWHGFAGVTAQVQLDRRRRLVELSGRYLAPRQRHSLLRRLAPELSGGWRLCTARLLPMRAQRRCFVPRQGLSLWSAPPFARRGGQLCTELSAGAQPLELLAETQGWQLLRAADGTLGWTETALPTSPVAPDCSEPTQPPSLLSAARSYLGCAYRLGGTSRRGLDCSGLVQRCYQQSLGQLLPRHSRDQWQLLRRRSGAAARLDDVTRSGLLFTRYPHGGWHVGLLFRTPRSGRTSVVHASTSRGVVVEDTLATFLRGSVAAGLTAVR